MRIRKRWITLGVVIGVIILALIVTNISPKETTKEIAMCIGRNSELYIQLGCHACSIQEEVFGENYKYLNVIDCFFEKEKCHNITYTPTWIIKGKEYVGVQKIEKLRELTGC